MMRTLRRPLGPILLVTLTAACGGNDQSASESPAKVENAVPEAQLATLTLSSQAETRLGLETSPVELRSVARTRQLGGEVTTVPGGRVVLTAPVTGVVLGPAGGTAPRAGDRVRRAALHPGGCAAGDGAGPPGRSRAPDPGRREPAHPRPGPRPGGLRTRPHYPGREGEVVPRRRLPRQSDSPSILSVVIEPVPALAGIVLPSVSEGSL
jgi:hypothetical protein